MNKKNISSNFYRLSCISCGHVFDEKHTSTICTQCHNPLEVILDYELIKKRLNLYALRHTPPSALKYLSFYPIIDWRKAISLNEGGTPLHPCLNLATHFNFDTLYIKNESMNPTGVFKDRGTLVEIAKVREIQASAVCLASTGNMAASVAAYTTLAKIPCYVLVPEGTPIGKLAQTLSFGARIIQVRGDYTDCSRLSEKMSKKYGFYLAGDYAFRLEGQKSIAFEIVEQLGWTVPDYVICPVGCGTNLAGIWKGFCDLQKLGFINKLPKLIGVQSSGCNPLVSAFHKKSLDFTVFEKPNTICTAVKVGNPLDGKKVLPAIYDSKGLFIDVEDELVLECEQLLAKKEAIFVEPSGAMPLAALLKLSKKRYFKKSDVICMVMTGNGLKDPKSAVKILPDPPTIDPTLSEIDRYLKSKLYEIQPIGLRVKDKVLWHKNNPDITSIKDVIKEEFAIQPSTSVMKKIQQSIEEFRLKGKKVTKQDMQNILEEHLDEYDQSDKVLEVIDFETKTTKFQKAEASISISLYDKKYTAKAKGTGSVDAIITALNHCMKGIDTVGIILTDYQVEIFSPGVAANVKVTIKAKDKYDNTALGISTSPDVIVASINAYEKCYNFLAHKQKIVT